MLCRIYKKNNAHRLINNEREDSMDDMTGPIPPSFAFGQQNVQKLQQLPKAATSYGGALLDNYQNLFGGMVSSDGINHCNPELSMVVPALAITSNNLPLKRTLPPSLYWDDSDEVVARKDGNASTSIATLLSQLPQTPSLHQPVILGSAGDSLFRAPCHLPGLNWYP